MLSKSIIAKIVKQTETYWNKEALKAYFVDLAKGKEIGHKMADTVDEKTSALLTINHQTKHQYNRKGKKRERGMGDIWLRHRKIYHPVNIKTGVIGKEGVPNLVSLRKLLSAILNQQIDSYYLLMVKMSIPKNSNISSRVIFTDLLDWLDYASFDAGPGQMMLRAKDFFNNYEPDLNRNFTIREKVERLFNLYEEGIEKLFANRKDKLDSIHNDMLDFYDREDWSVTPSTQENLLLR